MILFLEYGIVYETELLHIHCVIVLALALTPTTVTFGIEISFVSVFY